MRRPGLGNGPSAATMSRRPLMAARPWQYSRTRRTVMQVTMVGVLAATVGLAAVVGRSRTADLAVPLDERVEVGRLALWLPADWVKRLEGQDLPVRLVATEVGRDGARTLEITQEKVPPGRTVAQYLQEQYPNVPRRLERFDFLGQSGLLLQAQGEIRDMSNPGNPEIVSVSVLGAAVIIPDAAGDSGLAVFVQIAGEGAMGPSNRQFLKDLTVRMELLGKAVNAPGLTATGDEARARRRLRIRQWARWNGVATRPALDRQAADSPDPRAVKRSATPPLAPLTQAVVP